MLQKTILQSLGDYLDTASWSESRKILEKQPELLSGSVEVAARELEDRLTDPAIKKQVNLRRSHLHRCRAVGVSQAYQECASLLFTVAISYLSRFEKTRDHPTLDSAITIFEDVARLSADIVAVHADILNDLGYALRARYLSVSHSDADLARAIEVLEQSVSESPPGAPYQDFSLANLLTFA